MAKYHVQQKLKSQLPPRMFICFSFDNLLLKMHLYIVHRNHQLFSFLIPILFMSIIPCLVKLNWKWILSSFNGSNCGFTSLKSFNENP